MNFDWISWGLGVLVFIICIIQTTREFKEIFKERSK